MRTISERIYSDEAENTPAKKYKVSRVPDRLISRLPLPEGVDESSASTMDKQLRPVCPDPDTGFTPLSQFLVKKLTQAIMDRMRGLCQQRRSKLDFSYWEKTTHQILSSPEPKTTYIIASPPGSGKSTWIEAFTTALAEQFRSRSELARALVGIVVVLQKVEDLNRLAEVLNQNTLKEDPNMIALQGWSISGQRQGFCVNTSVTQFEDCHPTTCPYAYRCELRTFGDRSLSVPIVGLTQERFSMLRSSDNLDKILFRLGEDGCLHPRRYLIFDEKFSLAQVDTLDKDCIDKASSEFTQLISKMAATDSNVRRLQQSLSYSIERPFQMLRGRLCVQDAHGRQDIQAGFCTFSSQENNEKHAYEKFRKLVMGQRREYATKSLRTAFAVMDRLYAGEQCLFSKTNGFAVTSIAPPQVQFGECQSVIFDATAKVDMDYHSLEQVKFLTDKPKREMSYIRFHIYTAKELNVSKQAMDHPWKIEAFSQLIAELTQGNPGRIFVCTYKRHAETFAEALQGIMKPDEFERILLMPGCDRPTLPYFGGTNGSNAFSTAQTVFMLGYPRLDPRNYLIQTCAAYGQEQLAREIGTLTEEQLLSKSLEPLYSLRCVKSYVDHHLAARLEQEIYRCSLRNQATIGYANIYLFHPPRDVLHLLMERIQPERIIHKDVPDCVVVSKRAARKYNGGDTGFGRLSQFLSTWDGNSISSSILRERLGISHAVWKDLLADSRVKELLKVHQVVRKGRGRSAVWYVREATCA